MEVSEGFAWLHATEQEPRGCTLKFCMAANYLMIDGQTWSCWRFGLLAFVL